MPKFVPTDTNNRLKFYNRTLCSRVTRKYLCPSCVNLSICLGNNKPQRYTCYSKVSMEMK